MNFTVAVRRRSNVMTDKELILFEIESLVSKYTKNPFSIESEIFYELKIYGDDLFEIFEFFIDKYNIDFSNINLSEIAPGEGGGSLAWITSLLGFRPYIKFTIGDLYLIILNSLERNSQ